MRGAKPLQALETAIAEKLAIAPGERVVVAASGGPDSTALAALATRAAREPGGRVVLAHVNHGLRSTAWQDEAVVLALGAALGLAVHTRLLPPGSSAEEYLRDARYAALGAMAREAGAARVLTAHHAEDQTETVLLALFRGAGPDGLAGMPAKRPLGVGLWLERPLLGIEPGELRAYCFAERLAFALDPTNADVTYRRNAVRSALAALRESFPHLDAAVARCAAILSDERQGAPRALARRRLRAELVASEGDARDLTFERLDAATRALERKSRGRHFLRRGLELVPRLPAEEPPQ